MTYSQQVVAAAPDEDYDNMDRLIRQRWSSMTRRWHRCCAVLSRDGLVEEVVVVASLSSSMVRMLSGGRLLPRRRNCHSADADGDTTAAMESMRPPRQ